MELKSIIGRLVSVAYYDFQDLRIASLNRIRDVIYRKLEGIGMTEVQKKKDKKDYTKKYTDKVLFAKLEELKKNDQITKEEYDYLIECWNIAKETINIENKYKTLMHKFVKKEPIYIEFLSKIKGIGPVLSAGLIKWLGYCERFDTISKLWAYTGNGVTPDGIGQRRKKGEKTSFSVKLKAFTWKISDSLLKGNKGYYRKLYDEEKERQLAKEYPKGYLAEKYSTYKEEDTKLKLAHAHARAMRKMRKHFLAHYWECARELVNLPHDRLYVKDVLKHVHIIKWREAIEMEDCLKKEAKQES